jgi:hypothetical protein
VEIPAELARTKKLENLAADGCRLERIPDELFSSRALQTIDLTGNTFANDQYNDLERLAKAHPKIKVVMPRKGAKKPAKAISDPPLAESVRKDLDRLGAVAGESEEPIRELDIAGTPWPVPSALGELLSRASLRRAILAPFASDDMNRFGLRFDSSALEEHECIHHHPYVVFADTPTYFFLLLRLDDKKPADPMLYVLDSKDYTANEAQKFDRLSDWLKKARPADGTPPATKKSPRADGASRGATKKRHR